MIIEPFLPPLHNGLLMRLDFNGHDYETVDTANITYVEGRFGDERGAAAFNGVDSLVALPTPPDYLELTGSFSIAFFIQAQPPADHDWVIVGKHQSGDCQPRDTGWEIQYGPDTGLRFVNYDAKADCGRVILEAPAVDLLDGAWHHVVFVYDQEEDSMRLTVDLELTAEALETGLSIQNNDVPLTIGNAFDGGPDHALDAALDDLFIYQVAVDADFIQMIYEAERE